MSRSAPELESLRLLIDVAALGSLGRAARHAGISQPAASKRLTQLERELALPLATRSPTGSRLTAQGQAIAERARQVLDAADELMATVDVLTHRPHRDLRVAASMTIAEHLIPGWLARLQAAHPHLHVGLQVANSTRVQQLLLERRADIGFIEGPTIDPRLESQRVAEDRLAVVVCANHRWARPGQRLDRARLLKESLITREPGSGTRATLDRALGTTRSAPLLELGSNEAVKGAVLAGAGAAVLSALTVAAELADQRLIEVRVRDLDLHRPLTAVWTRNTPLSEPSRWLLAATAAPPH